MSQKVIVAYMCDVDGKELSEDERVQLGFGYGPSYYEMDLCTKHAQETTAFLEGLIDNAMKVGRMSVERSASAKAAPARKASSNGSAATGPKLDLTAIRAWAQKQGYEIADRGRISAAIIEAYENRRGKRS